MNPEDFYKAKRNQIFWENMIFYLILCVILAFGSTIVYLVLKWIN